ncbi:BPL-N domain-containing protein [Mobilicoccus pelagius]|uniref:Biotin-protein ligase N-terminal domain-containing protein n=1 Tax=Mobilicoccus pelagius NBRC 104925 TaxID=1089455 RepID=H5UVB1_9MICO|nr:BPL-N domain-containing protein [Mobilicoccus pelagius]GAB49669.1 hypothetical protein MOPEL_132_00360 [Mobilicoccus pelagius NBRC 104925]
MTGLLDRLLRLATGPRPTLTAGAGGALPDAVVYRGPATLPGCPEAVARALRSAGLRTAYIGPDECLPLTAESLSGVRLYAQPGGGELDDAWRHLRRSASVVRDHVEGGGAYLGFCLGAYLAGDDPGFDLLPGKVDQYVVSLGATIDHTDDALVSLDWGGSTRTMYFQDGAYVRLADGADAEVVARYDNGAVAALVCDRGRGRVGVVGPHPEAERDWYTDAGLPVPRPLATDLAVDLVQRVCAPTTG